MATWSNNPTITNTTSSAATLNLWRENAQYIYDLLPKVGPLFSRLRHAGGGLTQGNNLWTVFHRHQHLHYRVVVNESNIDAEIAIYVNGEKVSLATGSEIPPGTWSGSIDLDVDITATPSLGDDYEVWVDCDLTDTGIIVVEYLFEYPVSA